MATGWLAVEKEIELVVDRLVASDMMRRHRELEACPEMVSTMSGAEVLHYIKTGRLQ